MRSGYLRVFMVSGSTEQFGPELTAEGLTVEVLSNHCFAEDHKYIIKAEGMENLQQPKPDPKGKAIASFWLGVISVIAGTFMLLMFPFFMVIPPLVVGMITVPAGLILGIMGLKSTKRNFAIAGIVLSIIPLLPIIFLVGIIVLGFVLF